MNDYQKEYMRKLEYDWAKDLVPTWTPCDAASSLLDEWDKYEDLDMWKFRNKDTKEPVPLEEVRSVLGGKKVGDQNLKVGDTVEIRGRLHTVVEVEGDLFWTNNYPREDYHNPYRMEDLTEVEGYGAACAKEEPTLEEHTTGAPRESKEGKGKPHLVLAGFPRALAALSRHVDCELGRQRNWEKGLPESSLIDSQFRHLMGYVSGVSEDTPEYNLTANVWNAMVLLEEFLRVKDGVMDEDVLDVEKK